MVHKGALGCALLSVSSTLESVNTLQPAIHGTRYLSRKLLYSSTAPASRISSVDISARNADWRLRSMVQNWVFLVEVGVTPVYHEFSVFYRFFAYKYRCISRNSGLH